MPIAPSLTTMPGAPFGYSGPWPDATTSIDPAGALNYSFTADIYTARALQRGALPFWNPHQGLGTPFLASALPAVLYPLTPLVAWVPRHAYEWLYLLNWLLAALFTYQYLRLIDVGTIGGLIGGLAIVCSGFFQYYFAEREVIIVAAWLPALLYGVERTLRDPLWRARHAVLAVSIYCAVTGGQPESSVVALMVATVYGAVSIARAAAPGRSLLALTPGVVSGTLLSAPFWWNFSDYAFAAYSAHGAGADVAQTELGWRTMASYVMPHLYGRLHTLPPSLVPRGWSWDLSPGWIPVATAIGVLFGVAHAVRTRSRPLLLVFTIGLVVAGKIWGIWPLHAVGLLPLLDRVVFPRYAAFVVAFAAAILAGAGWDAALTLPYAAWRRAVFAWLLAAVALYLAAAVWREPVFRPIQVRAFSVLIAMWAVTVPAGLLWMRSRASSETATAAAIAAAMLLQFVVYKPGAPPEMYAVLTVACLAAWLLMVQLFCLAATRAATPAFLVATTLGLCALPSLSLALSERRGLPLRYDAATEPPYVHALRELQAGTHGRAFGFDGTPQPNFGVAFGIDQLNTLEAVLPQGVAGFFQRHLDPGTNPLSFSANTGQRRSPGALEQFLAHRRFFELAAVRYVLTRTTVLPRDSGFRLSYADAASGVQIWENERALPRAFLACPESQIATGDAALARLPALTDLRRVVVVDRIQSDPCQMAGRAASGTLEALSVAINGVTVRYQAHTPGILVLTDAYDPGWRATIDGAAADVLCVDGVFRGVSIAQPGTHVVEFSYEPRHWRASLVAAGAGAIVLAAFTLRSWRTPT